MITISTSNRTQDGNLNYGKKRFAAITKRFSAYLLVALVTLVSSINASAQLASNYAFSSSTGVSLIDISSGSTTMVAASVDDAPSAVFNIGFPFVFMGTAYTQFSASPDGFIRLGGTAAANQFTNLTTSTTNIPKLSPYWDDQATGVGGYVRFKTIGVAPNRQCVVEWFVTVPRNTGGNANASYQTVLNESDFSFSFIYGAIPAVTTNYTVGFTHSATQFASITTSSNTVSFVTANDNNNNAITAGQSYTFAPTTFIDGGVTNLSFTAVTLNSLTVNWEDNSTNESFFKVERSTVPDFTQNVQVFDVASTSSATTGTAYNLAQTGLSPGTTYYYRVYAGVEGAISSPISGNETTLNGATYYWTGGVTGNWNDFANWNTEVDGSGSTPTAWATTDVHILDGSGGATGGDLSIVVNRPSFTVGQVLITDNTNVSLSSDVTTTRVITISGGGGDDFVIENGSSLNLINETNRVAFIFSGTATTGVIAGNYTASGGTASPNNITTTGGTGTLVRVTSTGVVTSNINGSTAGLVGSVATLLFENGSNWIHQNSTTVNYIPTATWEANATATLNGNTTGTTLTSVSTVLGNLVVNMTASTSTVSAFTFNTRTIQGDLTINSTGSGRFRAVTSGNLTVNGNIIVNNGILDVASASGNVIVNNNIIVESTGTIDVNQGLLRVLGNFTNNGSIFSSETTTTASRINFFGESGVQTFSGTGTFTGRVSGIGVLNPNGLTVSAPMLTQRVNLFVGAVTGSNNITIGTGLALPAIVQISQAANTVSGGSFDVSPTFNLGTGTYSILYLDEPTPRTIGFEIPTPRTVTNITVNNLSGVVVAGGPIEISGTLTLTNGLVTSSLADHFVVGTDLAAATITGGSNTSYLNGPVVRTINNANANTNFIFYPVGKGGVFSPIWLAPTTTSVSKFLGEAFDSNAGSADPSISNLSTTRRWEALPLTGTFDDIHVRLSDAGLTAENIVVHASSANGVYSGPFGSPSIFVAGPPSTIQSPTAVNSADYVGYLSVATSNACDGTPTPGATTATETVLCLGESTTLSITDVPTTSGNVYQWQSSTDGVTYNDIVGATSLTLVAAPNVVTFYQCVVTCTASSLSATSSPIQIVFDGVLASTTPATRCGTGSVTLEATAANGNINWYTSLTGGSAIASGNSFTTPELISTTSYYAAAETQTAGSLTLGNGATTSSAVGSSFFPGFWGGAKTQYIIRANELIAAGLQPGPITSLGFEPTTSGQTYQGFNVYIGETDLATAPTGSFIANTELSKVYSGTLADDGYLPVANVLNTLQFGIGSGSNSSFIWDGTSNIVVSISWSRVPAASTATSSTMRVDNVGFVSTAYRQRDNFTPEQMLEEVSVSLTTSNRPRFTINGQVLCSSPRTEVVATISAPPALTLSSNSEDVCDGEASALISITSNISDYDEYIWSPSVGVSGNINDGFVFNPISTTTYTLSASQSAGDLCVNATQIVVIVNPIPSEITISAPSVFCTDDVQTLTANGGTLNNIVIFEEDFENGLSAWTAINNTTGGSTGGPDASAWVITPSPSNPGGLISNDASNFVWSNVDASGSGVVLDARLISPSFSTVNYTEGSISYFHRFQVSGTTASLEYSLDNGTTWTNIITYTTNQGTNTAFVQATHAFPPAMLNQPNVKLRFSHLGGWGWRWAIDNLLIQGTQTTTINWSPEANLFLDADLTTPYILGTNATTVYYEALTPGNKTIQVVANSAAGCTSSSSINFDVFEPTFSSITETACESYTAPDGTVYTTSGVYTSVIPNAAGCDSTITINLTVIPNTQVILNPVICEGTNYLSPAGNIYSATGTYTEQVLPVDGCPVVFTINLTVNPSTSSETVVTECDTYTWNGTTYITSGTYTVTGLTNANGCDSTATLVLTINNSFESTETVTACDSYEWSNGTVYTESGTYVQELQTVAGCDSTLTLILTINESNTGEVEVTACDEFTWNGVTYTESGEYIQVLQNAAGCDSTVTLTLTINNSSSTTVTASACGSYTWSVNGATYTESGTYSVVLQNAAGCDSTITLELTINNFTVIAINNGNATLTANAGVSFQWVTCPTFAPIAGATSQLFTAEQNGNYAVIATDANGCVDTSSCVSIVNVGLEGFEANNISIYPNPTEDFIVIDFTAATATVEILDIQGKLIRTMSIESGNQVSLKNEQSAVYFVRIITDQATTIHRIVKQ